MFRSPQGGEPRPHASRSQGKCSSHSAISKGRLPLSYSIPWKMELLPRDDRSSDRSAGPSFNVFWAPSPPGRISIALRRRRPPGNGMRNDRRCSVMTKPRRNLRPRLDSLEDRCLLSGYTPAQLTHAYGLDAIAFRSSSGAIVPGDGSGRDHRPDRGRSRPESRVGLACLRPGERASRSSAHRRERGGHP